MDHSPPGFSVHGILQARILGCHFLLQGIFLTKKLNWCRLCLPRWQEDSLSMILLLSPISIVIKNPPANAADSRDAGLIPGSGRSSGGRNGKPLRCSCLGNPMDRGAWWAMVYGIAESDAIEHLSVYARAHARTHTHTHTHTLFIYFWLCWVFIATRGLSLVAASGVYLHCGARASHSHDFSCFRAQALGTWASAVAAHRISSCDKQAH